MWFSSKWWTSDLCYLSKSKIPTPVKVAWYLSKIKTYQQVSVIILFIYLFFEVVMAAIFDNPLNKFVKMLN